MARIAINGIGRIGKLVLRAFMEEGTPGEIVLLNDPVGDPAQHAHLLEFDTVQPVATQGYELAKPLIEAWLEERGGWA